MNDGIKDAEREFLGQESRGGISLRVLTQKEDEWQEGEAEGIKKGRMEEQIAQLYNDRERKGGWCKYENCKKFKDNCGLCLANQILPLVQERIKEIKSNAPVSCDGAGDRFWYQQGFEEGKLAILKALEE